MASPYNGTLINSPTFVAGATGFGNEISLVRASSHYVNLSSNYPPAMNPAAGATWTWECWFKTSDTTDIQYLLAAADSTNTNACECYVIGSTGHVEVDIPSAGLYISTSAGGYANGARHHFRVCYNGTNLYLFLDGTLQNSGGTSGSYTQITSPHVTIGCLYSNTVYNCFNGNIDEVAIFSVCLKTSNFTPPSAPYANSVANGQALYHLDGDATDSYQNYVSGSAAAILGLLLSAAGSTGPSSKSGIASANLGLLLSSTGATSPTSKSGTAAANLGLLIASAGAVGPSSKVGTASAALGLLLDAAGATSPTSKSGTAQAVLGLLLTAAGSGIAAIPVPFAPRPRTSYPEPVFDPGSAPGDSPIVYIPVNRLWLPYIAGALTQLQQRSVWKALNQQQLQDLIGRVNDLIAAFGAGEQ